MANGGIMENRTENDMNLVKPARRSFMKGAGMTGLGLAAAAVAGARLGALDKLPGASKLGLGTPGVKAASVTPDVEVGQFALNLEYLEAEFYTMAVTGKTLAQSGFNLSGHGTAGATTGGAKVDFSGDASGKLATIAMQIMQDEQQHVLLLRKTLTPGYTIAKPAINLDALGIGFATFEQFLVLARAFEDTGVSAYGGAVTLFNDKSYLQTAVQVGLLEAYHASNIRLLIAENNVDTSALDSQDILPPPSGTDYFNDTNALTTIRTTSEVLSIVYANSAPGTDKGGFFPNGVNGAITTV
jgi:hypothetical protein